MMTLTPIHKEGWRFSGAFAAVTLLLFMFSSVLGFIGLVLTAWCLYFFRDPRRVVPARDGLVVSPADGVVQAITAAALPKELKADDTLYTRVSIFLNVFDVHVNRIPCKGMIQRLIYHPGLFFNASLDKASEHNERQTLLLKTYHGHEIGVVQIAGLIARRIRCDVKEGQEVKTGERYGLIRFGSRVDIYLPPQIHPLVIVGQRVTGGETVIADFHSKEGQRAGEIL